MRRRRINLLIAVVLGLCITAACVALFVRTNDAAQSDWVEYTPVVMGNLSRLGALYESAPELNTPQHKQAFIKVLMRYGQEVSESNGRVFIRPGLAHDQDLLMNFTQKAEEVVNGRGDYLFR